MSNNLTPEDMADYNVQVSTIEGTKSYSLRAAYTTIEPGWLVLKDQDHRTVAVFRDVVVVMAERIVTVNTKKVKR